jgi:hypothetical protein
MAHWRGNQRQLLDAAGIDSDSTFPVMDEVPIVLRNFDTIRGLGAHKGTHGWFSALLPAVAARFGGIELLSPPEGMWLTFLNGSGSNMNWLTSGPKGAASGLTADLALIGYVNVRSQSIALNSSLGGAAAVDPTTLLPIARTGTAAASVGGSSLLGGSFSLLDGPLWLPPACSFLLTINVANTAGFLHAKVFVGTESRG